MVQPTRTGKDGIALIKEFEGFQPRRYICPAGKPTIGYGHVIQPEEKFGTLTEQQATDLLMRDLVVYEREVMQQVRVPLTQEQFDALVSFTYNLGGASLMQSTLLKLLNKGDYRGACSEFAKWCKARVNGRLVTLGGLKRRREAEAKLFFRGIK